MKVLGKGALLTVLLSAAAQAHLVTTGLGPLYDGMSHFVLTPEDLACALAIALLGGQKGRRTGRVALFGLTAGWFAGGLAGLRVPGVEEPVAVAAVLLVTLGGLVATDLSLEARRVMALSLSVGLVRGFLNGSAIGTANLGVLGLVGITGALFTSVCLTAAVSASLAAAWARIAVRVAGSWIAAVGVLLLGWSLRGMR